MNIKLSVSGMSCGHCETAVSKALKSVEGVSDVQVNLSAGTASIEGNNVSLENLIAVVIDEGYGASLAA
jgi:copper chaperone